MLRSFARVDAPGCAFSPDLHLPLSSAILFNLYVRMDNKAIAGILYETADLLEIDGQDSFRIRSYRNAAQAIEAHAATDC